MPAPVAKPAAKSAHPLTHKVMLENGKTYVFNDPNRPGNPWQFQEGVWVKVPEYVALRLKEKAQDNLTVKAGSKVSSINQAKFQIERLGGEA